MPPAARLLILRAKTGKPLVYVEWGRRLMRSRAAAFCDTDVTNLP